MEINTLKITIVRTVTEEVEIDLYNYLQKGEYTVEGLFNLKQEIELHPIDTMKNFALDEHSYSKHEEVESLNIR